MAITTWGSCGRWSLECPPGAHRPLLRAGRLVVAGLFGQIGELVGAIELPVRRGGVHEDHIAGQVQQRGGAVEHPGGDLAERVEQEVHRRADHPLDRVRS
jgi:hypothetical protein